jgi:hypothetical protein
MLQQAQARIATRYDRRTIHFNGFRTHRSNHGLANVNVALTMRGERADAATHQECANSLICNVHP